MSKEAMELALEALKSCDAAHITDGGRQWYDEKLVDKAVEAIEKALAEQPAQQEPICKLFGTLPVYDKPAQQEPVTDEENERFSRDVSNFKGTDEAATIYALERFLKNRRAEQPAQQEPVAWRAWFDADNGARWLFSLWPEEERLDVEWQPLYTSPPAQRKPQFKEFIKWADAQGYDCAQTCNSDTGEWIVLNPMTADLWKAWQAARGIKGNA